MTQNLRYDLLERIHDGEASEQDQRELESMLAEDPSAMEYLGMLDNLGELLREDDAAHLETVSFDGLWDGVHAHIQHDAAQAAERTPLPTQTPPVSLFDRIKAFFTEHSSSWVTAAATAGAVAAVLFVFGPSTNAPTNPAAPNTAPVAAHTNPAQPPTGALVPVSNPQGGHIPTPKHNRVVKKIVEKHIIYVDSVDSADSDSTVVVNSLQDDDSAVIWILPEDSKPKAQPKTGNPNNVKIEVKEEPL